MRKSAVAFLFLVALSGPRWTTNASIQQAAVDAVAIDEIVKQGLADRRIPGAAVAIISNDRVVYEKGFGVANLETGSPVTSDMLFRISSNTKVFTAAALLMLAEEGKVRLREPVGTYVRGLSPALSRLTAHELMTHTAGLSDDLANSGLHDESALLSYVRSWKDDFVFMTPGSLWSYSSPGFSLAGAIVEEVGRRPYAEQIADRLFKPLGMARTTFEPTTAMTFPFSQGHHPSQGPTPTVVRPYPDNASRWPTGYTISNVSDLARFVRAFLNRGKIDGKQVIPATVVAQLEEPRATVPNRSDASKYGYGLYVSTCRGLRVVFHGGESSGFGSVIRMLPDRQLAVIGLWNLTGGSGSFIQITDKIMDVMLRPDVTACTAQPPPTRPSPTDAEMSEIAGTYSNPHLGSVTLVAKNQRLFLVAKAFDNRFFYLTGSELLVEPVGPNRFSVAPPGLRGPITLEILPGSGGRPEFVHFNSRAFKRVPNSR